MNYCYLFISLALTQCFSATPPPPTLHVCPVLKEYSKETQAEAARQLPEVRKEHPVVASLVDDYGGLRAQVRACQSPPPL